MEEGRKRVAEILLQIGAIACNLDEPFVFTSGVVSSVYVDCRKLISFPDERAIVIDLMVQLVRGQVRHPPDVVAGGETGGIPYAAWVAERLGLPLVYVRKQPKTFGRLGQVEGWIEEGHSVLLVEDMVFDGGSKLNFRDGLVRAGAKISDIVVIFEHGVEEVRDRLANVSMNLHSLASWDVLLPMVERSGHLTATEIQELHRFLADPRNWSSPRPRERPVLDE